MYTKEALMQRSALAVAIVLSLPSLRAAEVTNSDLEHRFAQTVRPFVTRYCAGCHGGATPAAQFDLRQYSTMAEVVRDYPRRAMVLEKLTAQAMPPKPLPQPPEAGRQQVIDWTHAIRLNETPRK